MLIREVMDEAFVSSPPIGEAVRADLKAVRERDPASTSYSHPFLYFKGFQALQSYRVAHWLWTKDRRSLALFLQNRISQEFAVDIHPAARIGRGILIDHGTGVVIGETAVVEDEVSMLHDVTLGGTGKETGDRHPKVRKGRADRSGGEDPGKRGDRNGGQDRCWQRRPDFSEASLHSGRRAGARRRQALRGRSRPSRWIIACPDAGGGI